ncbi:peptidyl-prolyl cis-trans isomerase, FKBP-type family protein [Histomonas meleagridis]|uniref:peptidyl-prolyl cis-trans isomerase, FKBP-type family protein n=1 Tax=Histomonas meleagridis TaxID=135588 RepID=UPI0035599A01|nr:peptidyl-prolyl cis-trans isomerase, FKBP-type family protein [Histomonas meleagridis]KAH0806461.1 peptidyl-prolyl cis-trans isomerase, FKBP-type family protein [Histomonas meleagridis]
MYATVYQYDPTTRENKQQGQFLFTILQQNGVATVTICRPGATPLLSFNLTKKINWNYQNQVFCYFTDTKNVQWLLQFNDAASAAQATAAVAALLSVTSLKDVGCYEYPQRRPDKFLQIGDRMLLSYYAFQITKFPYIGKLVSSNTKLKTDLDRSKIPTGWVSGILGMSIGSTRSIFVPAQYTCLENGSRDPQFPNSHLMIVTTLLKARFKNDQPPPKAPSTAPINNNANLRNFSDISDADIQTKAPIVQNLAPPPAEPEETKSTNNEPVQQQQQEQTHDEEPELSHEELERQQKLNKIKRIGVASAFAVPMFPLKPVESTNKQSNNEVTTQPKQNARRSSEIPFTRNNNIVPQQQQQQQKPINTNAKVNNLETKLENIEKELKEKLEILNNNIICDLISMITRVEAQEKEINELRKQINNTKISSYTTNSMDSIMQIEKMKKDAEEINIMNEQNEKRLMENKTRISKLKSSLSQNEEKAKNKMKQIIKELMNNVFNEVNECLDDNKKYSGKEVEKILYEMLRKNSFGVFDEIDENGLF